MAIPSKGTRRVRVGEHEYEWRIRKKPTYNEGAFETAMHLAVEIRGQGPRTVLVVNLKVSRPDNWIAPHQTAVTPAMLSAMIALALSGGWQPAQPGSPFAIDYPLVRDRP
jgi:hypothetical protein